ncbi:carbohydrate binding domain-containing protein [Cohnella cellulosilytica]
MMFSVFSTFPAAVGAAPDEPTTHTGTHMLDAALKGESGNWAYLEQEVNGITTNTDYTFGMWVRGGGIINMKVSANGSTVAYTRPAATAEWTYVSVDFNSGAHSGKMVFSIVDSAATAFPQNQVAGTMAVDDAFFGVKNSNLNLLQNAGFEEGFAKWNKYEKDVFTVAEGVPESDNGGEGEEPTVTTTVYSGDYSLKAELQGNPSNWAYMTQKVTGLTAGASYELGMWVKGGGAATLKLSKGSSGGSALKYVRQKASSDWVYWQTEYTADSNEDLYVSIYDSASFSGSGISQAEAQGTMYIDDVFFGLQDSNVNFLKNPGFEAANGLQEWTQGSNSAPIVFSLHEGTAGNGTPEGPGGPTDPTDPTDPENPDDPANVYAGNRSMRATPKGKKSDWKTVTQQVGGIAANTDYSFGAWMKGSGAVTIKAAKSNGDALAFIRPKATNTWTYVSTDFHSGAYSGAVTFSITDSAGFELPEAEAAGTMYLDDVYFGQTGTENLLKNGGFEEQLKYWGGDKGTVFTRYPDRSDNPPAEQYDGIDNLGVYSWDRNPEGVADFGEWVGRTPYYAEDFLEQNTWSDLEGGNRLTAWQGTPFAESMLWAAYPFPKSGGSLAAAANGDYNDHYRQLGENLIAAGMGNAAIRFGHEFNGGWYIWSVGNANDPDHLQKCQDFAEAFRQFVTTLRSIEGQQFKFVWNPSTSIWGVDLEAAFPGRDYVDFIGIDHYDQSWAQSGGKPIYGAEYENADDAERLRRQQLAWNAQANDGNWGLNMIANFAEDQGVPLGICEWGLALRSDGMGGGDNPYFIEKMYEWIENQNVAWHVYFNVSASDGDHDLYDTIVFPKSSAKFSQLWNPNGAPSTTPAIEPGDIAGISEPYVKIEGEDGVLTGSVHKLHGDPWASGGEIAIMYKSGNALSFANANKADNGIAIVYQGWQSDQKASLYVNGALVKKNILFKQNGRSWSHSYGYVVIDDVPIPEGATVKLQINPDDEQDNFDNFKVDYILLLGATGEYVKPEAGGDGDTGEEPDSISIPSRTSFTHSGVWALTANVKGTGDTNGSSYSAQPTLTAGTSYTFGAWIKGAGRMALVIQNTTSWSEVLVKPFDATNEWRYVSAAYTPTTTGKYNIKLGDRDSSGNSGRIYIDDVKLAAADGSGSLIEEDFEDGGVKWWHPQNHFTMIDYSAPGDSANAHSGSRAMKVNAEAATVGQETRLSPNLSLQANESYTFKLWAKGDGDFSVELQSAIDGRKIADESFSIRSGDWEEKTFAIHPEATADYTLTLINKSSEGVLYLDDLLLHAAGRNNLLPNCDFELGQTNWSENAAFSIIDFSQLVVTDGLIDPLDSLDKVKESSNIRIDGTHTSWYGGDSARAAKAGSGDGYLIYDSQSEIQSVSISLYEDGEYTAAPLTVAVSDGGAYREVVLTADTYANDAKTGMPLVVYESYEIPAGMNLLKITLTDHADPNAVQISEVVINANSAPVTADPNSGEITAGQWLTFSTIEPGGEIYYTIKGVQARTRYTGPIRLDQSAALTAWTETEGKKKSIVRTFVYTNADDLVVDRFGQIRSAEFTGKIHNDDEFAQAAASDEQFYDSLVGPGDRDAYGGLAGSKSVYQLNETGFFHIEKLNGKSVMVDPIGNLYFNLAVNGTGYVDETFTVVNGRESVYEWLPGTTGDFKTAYDGSGNFSFYVANLIRQSGQPFNQAQYSADSVELVKSLGFTGLGAWSNAGGMPYVAWLPMPNLKIGDSGLFDIFHPDMLNQMDAKFSALANNRDDGDLIGYLFGNELPYDKLKSAVPAASASTGSKARLVTMLAAKYGSIESFNTAWGLDFASFDALRNSAFAAKTALAAQDMDEFTKLYLDELYKQIAYYAKKYDPNHLVMGDRWLANVMNDSKLREYLSEYAGKYMDVLTYNYYTYDLNLDMLEHLYEVAGQTPFIMTEFHYGDPTTGLTFAARMAEDEHEKGLMYRNYVEKAAASGFVVGANWFAYFDQAPTGRWFQGLNGEAGAIGLINVANRPYRDFLASVSDTNGSIYDILLGRTAPYSYSFKPGQGERASDKVLQVTKSGTTPAIGAFSEPWEQAVTANLTDVDLVLGLMKQGIGGQMSLTWDDEYFYIRAHIDDSTPMQSPNVIKGMTVPAAKAYLWAGDAVELFIGPSNVDEGGAMQFNDSQILLAAAPDEQGAVQTAYYWTGYREQEQPEIDMAAQLDADGKGYTIDAKIAFADMGLADIGDGTVIRYDMGFDEGGANGRERQFYWNGVDGNSSNREKWGQIVLKESGQDDDQDPDGGGGGDNGGQNPGLPSSPGNGYANAASPDSIEANGRPVHALEYDQSSHAYTATLASVEGSSYLKITGKTLAAMSDLNPGSVINIFTPFGGYSLPTKLAEVIPDLAALLERNNLTEGDISLKITLTDTSKASSVLDTVGGFYPNGKVIASASYAIEVLNNNNGHTILSAARLGEDLSRTIRLPESFELPEFFGVWRIDESSGSLAFVPHALREIDGIGYVVIASPAEGTYVVAANHVQFEDVPQGKWYTKAIEQAAAKRLVIGVGGEKYAPSRTITRAEFTRMISNLLQLAEDEAGGQLPNGPLTREEMANLIAAAAKHAKGIEPTGNRDPGSQLKDFGSVDEKYIEDITTVYRLQIMQGVASDRFDPQGAVTRAQAAVVLMNMAQRFGLIKVGDLYSGGA